MTGEKVSSSYYYFLFLSTLCVISAIIARASLILSGAHYLCAVGMFLATTTTKYKREKREDGGPSLLYIYEYMIHDKCTRYATT